MKRKFGLLFLAAFLLRVISLNQSLWLDEAVTAKVVRQFALFDISTLFSPGDFHPPLYYIFMKLWSFVFGSSEISLRMPSVIFSLLTGHAVFLIGSRLRNPRFGLWAAAIYLLNPLGIYYAQEARMYSLVTFLLAFALYFVMELIARRDEKKEYGLVRLLRKLFAREQRYFRFNEPTLIVLFNLFLVLAMWTFYGSAFFIAALILLLVFRKKYKYVLITLAVIGITLVLQYPLLSSQLALSRISLGEVANWKSVLGPASVKNLLLIPLKFSIGRISFYPKIAYYFFSGLWTLFVFSFVVLGGMRQRFLIAVFAFPLLLAFVFSFFTPLLQYFRFLYLVPVMSVLAAEGVEYYIALKRKQGFFHIFQKLQSRPARIMHTIRDNALFEILCVGFLFYSLSYLLIPQFHREDWKSLSQALPDNGPVYMILPSSDPILYYRNVPLRELRNIDREVFFEKDTYVLPYTAPIYGFDYETSLHNKGCFRKEKYIFREVYYEKWSCGFISAAYTP